MQQLAEMITDFSADIELTPELMTARRARICALEEAMRGVPEVCTDMHEYNDNEGEIQHHFATGVYGRELKIPAGYVIVSKIHRGMTFNIITEGVIAVISEEGYHTYTAPCTFVSKPYTKRVVIAHEDTTWVTAHGTHETDLDKIEEEIIAKDFTELNRIEGEV